MYLFKSFHEKRDFDNKPPLGFKPGTLRFKILYLTPRLRGKMQRYGDNYDMNQVQKSANSFEKRK